MGDNEIIMNTKHMSYKEFAGRVLIYGGLGKLSGLEGENLMKFALAAPIGEKLLGTSLEELIADVIAAYNKNNQVPSLNPQSVVQDQVPTVTNKNISETPIYPVTRPQSPLIPSEAETDGKWLAIIPHPSVVEILGRRGSGKTALGHRLLELSRFRSLTFVFGMPQQALKYLPEWLGVVNSPDEVPDNSTLLVDEANLRFNARDSQKQMNREMSRIINLSRQKQLTLLFVSHQARTIDKNITSSADVLIIKEPEPLQVEFERREIKELMKTAAEKFQSIKENRTKWGLVYSPVRGFYDMLTNELPSYWTEKLSCIYAFSGPSMAQKPARKMSKAEKIKRAKLLESMGVDVTQIKRDIGVRSRTTVYKYLHTPDEDVQTN